MTSRAPIGYIAISENELSTNQGFQSIRCYENKVDYNFIYYLLGAHVEGIQQFGNGATFKEISGSKLKKYKIEVPKLEIQKISHILICYDELIENNLKEINVLERFMKLTFDEWFLRFKIKEKKLTINKKTRIPINWEIVKVKSLLSKVESTKKIKSSEIIKEGKIPVIDQSTNFISGFTNEKCKLLQRYTFYCFW